eukprot:1964196-Rhodomonas_salina.1
MGLLVLRSINPWRLGGLPESIDGPRLVSEVAGVVLLDDANIQVKPRLQVSAVGDDAAYACPVHDKQCVHVALNITLPADIELGDIGVIGRNVGTLACWRWSFSNWAKGNCSLSDLRLDGPSRSGDVMCNCNLDGLIVVAFVPHTVFRSNVVRVRATMERYHLLQPLIFTTILAVALGATAAVVCLFVRKMSKVDFPTFRAKSGWEAFCWVEIAMEDLDA